MAAGGKQKRKQAQPPAARPSKKRNADSLHNDFYEADEADPEEVKNVNKFDVSSGARQADSAPPLASCQLN